MPTDPHSTDHSGAAADAPGSAFRVCLHPSGTAFACEPAASLLEAARRTGLRLPSSCRNGTCRACRCRLLEGRVRYRIDWPGLSAEEKAEGWILPCVAIAETDLRIELERPPSAPGFSPE